MRTKTKVFKNYTPNQIRLLLIWAIIDLLKRTAMNDTNRIIWALVILFVPFLALSYISLWEGGLWPAEFVASGVTLWPSAALSMMTTDDYE